MSFLRLIFLIFIIYILYKLLWKKPLKRDDYAEKDSNMLEEEMKRDPVCGTYIPVSQAIKYKHKGRTYYFCSDECKKKFISLKKS